ncbi:putative membrane protein [Metabacillus niabensis]|uniref:Membrane protein n=1 Tax=Metabacillus niabensis TaxID=324854 RepID=A0ABT9Z170_9BACI|nr:putative membrane protein [Metabacillus niabensis]
MNSLVKGFYSLFTVIISITLFGVLLYFLQSGKLEYAPSSILLLISPLVLALSGIVKYMFFTNKASINSRKEFTLQLLVISSLLFFVSLYFLITNFNNSHLSLAGIYLVCTVSIIYDLLDSKKRMKTNNI